MKTTLYLSALCLFGGSSLTQAAVYAHYFTGITSDISNHAAPYEGLIVNPLNKGNGSWWNTIGGNAYPDLGDGNYWFQMPSRQTSVKTPDGANADLDAANGWISFSFQAEQSYQTLVLENLTFDWAWAVGNNTESTVVGCFLYYRTSTTGEWLVTDQSIIKTPPNTIKTHSDYGTISFDLDGLTGISDYVELALLFTDSIENNSNQTHLVGNLTINGSVIPEPATATFGMLGLAALLVRRKPRTK